MLRMYVNSGVDFIPENDVFFGFNTYDIVLSDKELQDILERVEGVTYIGDGKVISKFTDTAIDMSMISTGVKSLLNIVAHQDKVFGVSECGGNVVDELFRLNCGNVYSNCVITPFEVDNVNCEVVLKDATVPCNSLEDLWRLAEDER